jgi:hypothetical protein
VKGIGADAEVGVCKARLEAITLLLQCLSTLRSCFVAARLTKGITHDHKLGTPTEVVQARHVLGWPSECWLDIDYLQVLPLPYPEALLDTGSSLIQTALTKVLACSKRVRCRSLLRTIAFADFGDLYGSLGGIMRSCAGGSQRSVCWAPARSLAVY